MTIASHLCLASTFLLLAGASLHGQQRFVPPDAGIDVTRPPYSAIPDDGQDDTAALQRALTDNVGSARTLYFPAGVYDLSDTLAAKGPDGRWLPRLVLQGASREKTILRLRDAAPGFGDPAKPKALLMTGSHQQGDDDPSGGGNKAFGNYLFDLTIDTGSRNPGAVGVEYAVSNYGAIENVTIRSGDGAGSAGIAQRRHIPGPGLISNVTIDGFDTGVDVADIQYGMTLENVTVAHQRLAGIRSSQNPLHIRKLTSRNDCPAVVITAAAGALTLVDSSLTSPGATGWAIDCAGTLLVQNVDTAGYAGMRCRGHEIPRTLPVVPGAPVLQKHSPSCATAAPLLGAQEPPAYWNSEPSDWQAVGERRPGEPDDTAAIQRALDSGKPTIYFRNTRIYYISDTLIVRGAVRQVVGMFAEINLGAAKEPFSNRAEPRPLFRIDPTVGEAVFFERLFLNAQYPGEVIFLNNSPQTLVIRHCAGWVGAGGLRRSYRNTPRATGKVYIEDVFLPGWEFTGQQVWARQFNPENPDGDGQTPQVSNIGGRLWILGFKTEGPAPFLRTSAGGTTQLLGAYNYISATNAPTVPAGAVPYEVIDAAASLTFVTDNFRGSDYRTYIRNTRRGQSTDLPASALPPRSGNPGDHSLAVPLHRTAAE